MDEKTANDIIFYLALIGGIVALIEAIINIALGVALFDLFGWIGAIIAIPIAILVLLVVLKDNVTILNNIPIPYEWWILLIFGIILIVFGSAFGGILVLIAGIVKVIIEKS